MFDTTVSRSTKSAPVRDRSRFFSFVCISSKNYCTGNLKTFGWPVRWRPVEFLYHLFTCIYLSSMPFILIFHLSGMANSAFFVLNLCCFCASAAHYFCVTREVGVSVTCVQFAPPIFNEEQSTSHLTIIIFPPKIYHPILQVQVPFPSSHNTNSQYHFLI